MNSMTKHLEPNKHQPGPDGIHWLHPCDSIGPAVTFTPCTDRAGMHIGDGRRSEGTIMAAAGVSRIREKL